MKTKNLLLALGLSALASFGQVQPNIDYVTAQIGPDGTATESFPSVIDQTNAFVYIAGYNYNNSSQRDYVLIKYDAPTGAIIWQQTYNFANLMDRARALSIDNAGNIYVTGESQSATGYDIATLKYDPNGNLLWSVRYNGTSNLDDRGSSIAVDNSSNVYVCGYASNTGTGKDFTVIKYNSSGVQQYVYTKNGTQNGDDVANVLISNGNRIYVTGNVSNNSTNQDIYLTSLNANNGNVNWFQMLNGNANGNDQSVDMKLYGNDLLICGGITNTGTGQDFFFSKFNSANGNVAFTKVYNGFGGNDFATSLVADASNKYAVVGLAQNGSNYEYHTVYFLNNGNQSWVNKHLTYSSVASVYPKIDRDIIANHFYVSGLKQNATLDGGIYQITPGGNETWADYYDGPSGLNDAFVDFTLDNMARIYVASVDEFAVNALNISLIRYSQTPVYFPPDFGSEPSNNNFYYLKNFGQIMNTSYVPATTVLYATVNQFPDVYIQKNSYKYVFQRTDTIISTPDTIEGIEVNFLGSNPFAKQYEYNPKGLHYNYYLGHALSPAITDVQGNERVFIPNYYPNIDLHYFSNKNGIKYYFVLKPFGENDFSPVRINIAGANATSVLGNGKLFIDGTMGDVTLEKPIAYQVNPSNNIVPLSGSASWNSLGGDNYNFNIPSYNSALPVVVELRTSAVSSVAGLKQNLDYSTYYGGSSNDIFNDVAAAANGDRYVTGYTTSGVFPTVNAATTWAGANDIVILKYTADDTLRYATFHGGSGQDFGNTIAVTSLNEIYVGGYTSSTDMFGFNVTGATNQFNNGGGTQDGFILKMASIGTPFNNTLIWRRYFGGSGGDQVNSIYVDASNNFYVAGWSTSTNFPVINALKPTISPTTAANPGNYDAIFGKFNSSMSAQWITYYGGSANAAGGGSFTYDQGYDIVVDNSGNAIGCGVTDAVDLQTTNTTGNSNTFFDNSIGGSSDGFLVRYNPSGTSVDFSSYFGGNSSDALTRMVFKSGLNEIHFAGNGVKGTGFPFYAKAGATNSQYSAGSGYTAFLGYMDGTLTKQWCSYYGKGQVSGKLMYANGLSVDNSGLVYLSGYTTSDTLMFPGSTPSGVYVDNTRSLEDGYIAVFTPGKLLYHAHYFGGSSNDRLLNSDIALNQKLYVTGYTTSNDFPVAYTPATAALIDSTYNGGQDGYISRFDLATYQIIGIQTFELDNSTLSVFPNPANTQFIIKIDETNGEKINLKIYNTMGQIISEKELTDKLSIINCDNWASGVYILNVGTKDSIKTFKLIKE